MNLFQQIIQSTFKIKPMKTSDKLLLFLILAFLVATLGSNLILRNEYKKVETSTKKH